MPGGMRIDPKSLPLHMQEQEAMSFIPGPAKAAPVAGHSSGQKVQARRLRFPSFKAAQRYHDLRMAEEEGFISDLVLHTCNGYVCAFGYLVIEEL